MTTIASSLAKNDDGLPLINRSSLAQISGVTKHLTRAEFDAAVAAERVRISTNSVGLYQNGERLEIIGEAGSRIWTLATGGTDAVNAAASHAKVVNLGLGKTITLTADSNVALSALGQPSSGTGANGDISVDFSAQLYYTKSTGAWGVGVSTVFNGLSAAQVAAAQVLALGSVNYPLVEAVNVGAPASVITLMGNYITTQSNMPSTARNLGGMTFANSRNSTHVYVDPVNGLDSNTGYAPETAKRSLNPATWTNGITSWNPNMFVMVARGADFTVSNILGQSGSYFSGSMSLGSYGDPTKPRPILRMQPGATALSSALCWMDPDGATLADMDIDCSGMDSASLVNHGVRFTASSNTSSFKNVLVSNVRVRAPRIGFSAGSPQWPGGITMHKPTTSSSNSSAVRAGYVRVEGCEVFNGGAHGIQILGAFGSLQANGEWGGVDVVDNVVRDCGKDIDSHGFTSVCDNAYAGQNIPWVLVSGTRYYVDWATLIGRSVGDIDFVCITSYSRDGCLTYLSKNTATPTTPAIGEFGFDNATQRLYTDTGAAMATNDVLSTSGQPPRGVLFGFNQSSGMVIRRAGPYIEGAGLQFDDWTSNSYMIGNKSLNNAGAGLAVNKGAFNRLERNFCDMNGLGGIGVGGPGSIIAANVIRGGRVGVVDTWSGLIIAGIASGVIGVTATQIRRNVMYATMPLEAFIYQPDSSGYYGEYTKASGNWGGGSSVTKTVVGKVIGF
jgi:hypothetical protein